MPKRKKPSSLPPQFARARRRRTKQKPEVEKTSAKRVPSKAQKQSVFSSLRSWLGFAAPAKTTTKAAPKKSAKKHAKKSVKTPAKKSAKPSRRRKGVIATKAEKAEAKSSNTKKAPKKAKKKPAKSRKTTRPERAAVRNPTVRKVKTPDVHFTKMNVTKRAEQADAEPAVYPQLVQDAPSEKTDDAPEKKGFFSFHVPFFGKKKAKSSTQNNEPLVDARSGGAIASLTRRMEGGADVEAVLESSATADRDSREADESAEESSAEVEAEIKRLEQEMADMDEQTKKSEKKLVKKRSKELKELRKKAKAYAKEIEAEQADEDEAKSRKKKMLSVDQRIAEKEAEKQEKAARLEEQERRKAQANKDLDAMAQEMVSKKKKKGGGISGILKSINNLGMGKYRAQFVQNLAMMLGAGLPLVDALRTLQMEVRSRAMRKVIARIAELVDSGHPLWRAMDEQYLFSPYEVALVRVGEEAGNLSRNMAYLAEQQEKDHALKQKVKMAMIYPTIVLILMFIVVMGLGLFVLPNLVQVLYSLNAELPATTRAVIFITELFSTYGKQAIPVMLGGALALFLLAKYTPLRVVAQWFVFRIPGIGRLAREATIARFGVILGGLLEAGVPLVESLRSLEDVTHIVSYKKMYREMTERVALGDSFAICFKDIRGSRKLIPISMQQLIVTGERSGSLSETFLKVASIYEKKAEETAEKLPTILEPMLLLIIGGLVGTIAFAIITPIYSVVGNVGR